MISKTSMKYAMIYINLELGSPPASKKSETDTKGSDTQLPVSFSVKCRHVNNAGR